MSQTKVIVGAILIGIVTSVMGFPVFTDAGINMKAIVLIIAGNTLFQMAAYKDA